MCELTDSSYSYYTKKKNRVTLMLKCVTSKNCPVKWKGWCTPTELKLNRIGEPKHKVGEMKKLRLKPDQTSEFLF